MPMLGLPVRAEAPRHRRHREGGEVHKHSRLTQNKEPGVVGNQVKPAELLLLCPADPAVPRPALECTRLPAGKADPLAPPLEDVAQAPASKPLEAEVMMPVCEPVPAPALLRPRETHDNLPEAKPAW